MAQRRTPKLLLFGRGGGWRRRSHTLLRGRRWGWIGDALYALFEALQALAKSLAQLRQALGAKQKKRNYAQHYEMPGLK